MISIIVPVYKAGKYIEETIDSVVAQTYSDWELLLVDDCSPDDSADIIVRKTESLENYDASKIRLIRKQVNEGAASARNTGIDAARGRYIAFLDADDLWDPCKLEETLKYMQRHDAAFVFTAYHFGDEEAVPTGKVVRVPKTLNYKRALTRTIIFTSTVLFDTEKISKDRLYMPKIGSEDTATWWRILRSGVIAYGLDKPLVTYRRPVVSLSSNKGAAVKRIWNLYRKEAKLDPLRSGIYLVGWAWRATKRRVVKDNIGKMHT